MMEHCAHGPAVRKEEKCSQHYYHSIELEGKLGVGKASLGDLSSSTKTKSKG